MGHNGEVEGIVVSKPAAIVLASRIGAGKSTLAQALKSSSGYQVFTFGQYVAQIARVRNIVVNRAALQDLGQHLVSSDPASFTKGALTGVDLSAGVIIDGLRHQSVLEQIRLLANPVPVIVVFIRTERKVRIDRLMARGMNFAEIETADDHIMERSLEETLLPSADIVVDGSVSADLNAQLILDRAKALQ